MHSIDALVINCIDFRLHANVPKFLKKEKVKSYDLISIAGAAHKLVVPVNEAVAQTLWDDIGISLKLHNPKNIYIIDHEDCGMYKATGHVVAGMSLEEDKAVHQELLREIETVFQEKFPEAKVKLHLCFAQLDGQIVPLYEENFFDKVEQGIEAGLAQLDENELQ
jgi:carbonic anhydrase